MLVNSKENFSTTQTNGVHDIREIVTNSNEFTILLNSTEIKF